ncbi:MAG: MFS transporter [Paracoccus sp. (in: a-proteobacteria)]
MSDPAPPPRAGASIAKLALANGLSVSAAVISVTASALVARRIGWEDGLTTVPYGLQFLSLLVATFLSARLMRRIGRKPVFLAAAAIGVAGGALGYASVIWSSPLLLCLAHIALGIQLANGNFYRFAVLELSSPAKKAQAMSLVVAGGTFAAIIGPYLSRQAVFSADVFASAYLGVALLAVVIGGLIATTPLVRVTEAPASVSKSDMIKALSSGPVLIGMAIAALGYGVMNLLMISASLALDGLGCGFSQISYAIQWHVLAMFLPSLVMGRIVARFGAMPVAVTGVVTILLGAIVTWRDPLNIPLIEKFLILLGLGWNMTYVAGSFLVAANARAEHALAMQASNDVAIGIFAMIGAFLPGPVMAIWGWAGANALVAAAMLGLIALALMVQLSLRMRPEQTPAQPEPTVRK